jgi:hypothetical protein
MRHVGDTRTGRVVHRLRSTPLALLMCLGVVMTEAGAQARAIIPPIVIAPRATCERCELVRVPIVDLGSATDPVLLDSDASVARDSRGRWFAVGLGKRSIVEFSPTGRYVRAVGRAGDGPGEFASSIVQLIVVAGDTLLAVESSGTVAVFSPTFSWMRKQILPSRPTSIHVVTDGQIVFNAAIPTPARAGYPVHVLARDGTIIKSFGAERPDLRARVTMRRSTTLSADKSAIWTGRSASADLDLQLWGVDGHLRLKLQLPPARIPGGVLLRHDRDGLLWVGRPYFSGAGRSAQPVKPGVFEAAKPDEDLLSSTREIIQVIDLERKAIIMEQEFPGAMKFLPEQDVGYVASYGADDVIHLQVFRMLLHRPR